MIERRDNPGFGAACNLALEHVTEDVTVLLNPDTEAERRGARGSSSQRARTGGLHAPRLLNPDGSVQRSAHPLPGTLGAFLPALVPRRCSPPAPRRAEPYPGARRRARVGWAIAACLAAQTDTLQTARPVRPAHPPVRRGHGPVPARPRAGHPDDLPPRPARSRHTGRHSVEQRAVRAARPQPPRRDRAHARQRRRDGSTTPRKLLTFATRALVKRPNDRSAPSWARSLNSEARACPGLGGLTRPLRGERSAPAAARGASGRAPRSGGPARC